MSRDSTGGVAGAMQGGGGPSAGAQGGEAQGGGGHVPHLPGASAEEEAILDPLFLDAHEVESASLEQLVALGARIGLARGYAMCRCVSNPERPPDDVPGVYSGCAVDEAGLLGGFSWYPSAQHEPRTNEDLSRCLRDEASESPALTEALRCELRRHQRDGQEWLKLCSVPRAPDDTSAFPFPDPDDCADAEQLALTLHECRSVAYCADGTRVSSRRCDGTSACADLSDERGCSDFTGRDVLQCGEELALPWSLCIYACGEAMTPPLCDDDLPGQFLCADGSSVAHDLVCDRYQDCIDGTDERYCLR